MDLLFITQYTCFIFMVINAMILGISSIHVRWKNKRYEQSRWLFFVAMIGFASQFFCTDEVWIPSHKHRIGRLNQHYILYSLLHVNSIGHIQH